MRKGIFGLLNIDMCNLIPHNMLNYPLSDIDNVIIKTFSELKSNLQKAGTPADDFDLLIDSTAFTMNSTLITNNEKRFNRIKGLKIENWSGK